MSEIVPENFCIKPSYIFIHTPRPFKKYFQATFANLVDKRIFEIEEVVKLIIVYCWQKDYWISFTPTELSAFANDLKINVDTHIYYFQKLIEAGLLVIDKERRQCATHEFVINCYKISPTK